MQTIKLTLAYDGGAYAGWQVQPEQTTLQGVLEAALKDITGESIRVVASGRTDAGVHALGQVVGFHTESQLPPVTLQRALNAKLPDDMAVLDAAAAIDGFHAIRDALKKRYRYVIHDGPIRNVFDRRYCWQVRNRLDVPAMDEAARLLLGKHDFSSFETTGAERESSVRTIFEIGVERSSGNRQQEITLEVEADGFLYNMVRAIVGSLVEVGRGAQSPDWIADVLASTDRRLAGPTAPPQGLFLVRVQYEGT